LKSAPQKLAAHREEDDQERIRMMVDRSFTDVQWVLKKVFALSPRACLLHSLLLGVADGGWGNAHSTE
jgi:hypothetical protein